ncbi:MAG: GerMN domain-containing protein [Christensenellaceae bacterium]|jgi:hypothetical protein|nr:GerMN domain-containing protein [Christensenellaceae bacterium]
MTHMKKRTAARLGPYFFASSLLALCLMLSACGPLLGASERNDGDPSQGYVEDILPGGEGLPSGSARATLWFLSLNDQYLAQRDYILPSGQGLSLEQAIIEQLIRGPEGADGLQALINPSTLVKQISEQSGYLSVTLSREFLRSPQGQEDGALRKRLALSSIVSSITELGRHSSVLILVDKQGDGTGDRLSAAESGFGDLGDTTLGPLSRDPSILLTPYRVAELALQALSERNYAVLEQYLTGLPGDGSSVADALGDLGSVAGFALSGSVSVSQDGLSAAATLDLSLAEPGGAFSERRGLALLLKREADWRVSYPSLLRALGGA